MNSSLCKTNWKLIFIFCFGFQFYALSQHISSLHEGVKGYWTEDSRNSEFSKNWKAQWIWLPDNVASDVMLARKTFDLTALPKEAKLRISASSKYQLYVNGVYVLQGPARSAPHHQSFDMLDISSLLHEGENTMAVRVHYQKGTISYHLKGRAGLLVQLDLNDQNSYASIISDSSWKVNSDLSWNINSKPINRFQLLVNDDVDLGKKEYFQAEDYNDSNWLQARPLLRNTGWPAPKKNETATSLTTPWVTLVPRDIPYVNENEIKVSKLIEAKQVNNFSSVKLTGSIDKEISKGFKKYLKNNESFKISASEDGKTSFLLFDFGRVVNGMPKLTIDGPKDTKVHVLSAPFVVNNTFTHKIVDSDFHDQITLSGEEDQWQAMYFKPTRYLAIAFKGKKEAVNIHSVGIHQLEYPFELKGTISTPEAPWIEALWNASVKTIDVCTTDAFTDNYRERRQYAQTGYYAALGNYFTYGDFALQRRYLIQVAQEQQANGLMPAYAPLRGDDYMVILDSNILYIRSLYNYLLYSGDYKTVKELLPSAEKLMGLLHSFTNELGMIDSPPYSYWLDHTLNDRVGANLCLNGHYLGALDDYSKILKWLDKTEESDHVKATSEKLRKSLNLLWDEEKQLFADALIDGRLSNQFSEHGNAMALACKVANPEQAELVAQQLLADDNHNYIKRENGITMVSPAMSYFLHKGLADNGYEEASLQLLHKRFNKMLDPNTNGTLWEEWWRNGTGRTGKFQERTRSDAQTESVFSPDLFTQFILGVEVTIPGMKEVLISKPTTTLTKIQGAIPTQTGLLYIQWDLGSEGQLKIQVPKNMKVKIDVSSFISKDKNEIKLNGDKVVEKDFTILDTGTYSFSF